MKSKLVLFLLYISLSLVSCGQKQDVIRPANWAQPVKELVLDNVYKIDDGVYRAEQPSAAAFKELEDFGIKEVLNLRYWHNDEKEAAGTGLVLHRVNMNAHDISDRVIIEALKIIKNRKGPIVIHCKHGSDRTGVLTAMYRVIFQDWSREEAIDELKNGGYGFHRIYFNIPNYIRKADIEKLKKEMNKI